MMKLLSILLLLLAVPVHAPLQAILLAELRSTHTKAESIVPASVAVKGLTVEQASWSAKGITRSGSNRTHSIAE
jgi:hypothetical protein